MFIITYLIQIPLKVGIYLIKLYKLTLSPFMGKCCKFYPTCSDYAIESINKYGLFKGGIKTAKRIIKCNPFSSGGYDPS